MRPEGGIITGLLPTWTTTNVKGMFSLREAQQLLPQSKWARGPIAPTNLTVTPQDAALALTWTAPATTHGTITNYLVEYTPSGGATTAVLTGSTSASYTITGLTNNVVYAIRVAGVNFTLGDYLTGSATPSASTLPNAVAGLQLWYDASDATTLYNATSGGSLSGTNGDVLRIEDKSGNARHATAVSGHKTIRRVSVVNSKDVLDVGYANTGGGSIFNIASSTTLSFLMQTTSTVFAVFNFGIPSSAGTPQVILGSGATTGYQNSQIGYTLGVEPTYSYNDKGNIVTVAQNRLRVYSRAVSSQSDWRYNAVSTNDSLNSNQWQIATVVGDMNQSTLANRGAAYKNGVELALSEAGTLTHSTTNTTNPFRLFGNYNGQTGTVESTNMFGGKFAELIVYNSVLSGANRNGIITYLSNKWGIA
jgi:hypothetical protein